MSRRKPERGVRVRIGAVGVPLPPLQSTPPTLSRRVGASLMQEARGLGVSPKRGSDAPPAIAGVDVHAYSTQVAVRMPSPRSASVLPTRSRSTLPTRDLTRPSIPVQEPTGKFRLIPPPPKPVYRRRRWGKSSCLSRWLVWAWHNAEPIGWMAALTALVISVWFSPRTAISHIRVQGVPPEAQAEVMRLIRDYWHAPLPLSDAPRAIERAIGAWDWVESVRWQAVGVGQVQLSVRPRLPFVALQSPTGTRLFIDPAGIVFLPPNPRVKPIAGEIRPTHDYPLPLRGTRVYGEMRKAFTILHALHQRHEVHFPRVQLSRMHGVRLWLEVVRGTERVPLQVRFGDASALEVQLQTLGRVLELPTTELRRWAYVDISTPSAEVVKPRATQQ